MMSGIILLSSKGKAPGLLRLRLATASLLAMTGEKTFYEAVILNPKNLRSSASKMGFPILLNYLKMSLELLELFRVFCRFLG